MKKQLFYFAMTIALVFTLFGTNIQSAQAALPNPRAVLPILVGSTAKYSQGPHLSGFKMGYITNPGQNKSSVDLGYSGSVHAPITGRLSIVKDCGDHQIIFIQGERNAERIGWAIGLTHIGIDKSLDGESVTQGEYIGKTVPPLPYPGKGCGYGSGSHIHYTLMKWKMATNGPVFTEQSIANTYIAQWIVKNTYLDGPYTDVPVGKMIEERIKIISVRSNKVIDAYSSGIQIWSYSSTNKNQKWIRIAAPNAPGFYYLKSVSRGKCMVVANDNNGTLITLATCDRKDHRQRFKLESLSDYPGQFAIRLRKSNKVLDVITDWNNPNSGTANGTRIQQWDPFFGNNQRWKISSNP